MKSKNAIGWFSGKIDGSNLYITEVQSDLLQRTYELSNKWLDEHGYSESHPCRQWTGLKSKLEKVKDEVNNKEISRISYYRLTELKNGLN